MTNRELPIDRRLSNRSADAAVRDLRELLRDVLRRLAEAEARLTAGGL